MTVAITIAGESRAFSTTSEKSFEAKSILPISSITTILRRRTASSIAGSASCSKAGTSTPYFADSDPTAKLNVRENYRFPSSVVTRKPLRIPCSRISMVVNPPAICRNSRARA